MENEMPPLEAIKSLCFVEEYGYGYEYEIVEKTFQQYKQIEDEYCVIDNKDLRRRLDLADRYGELSEQLGIDLTVFIKAILVGFYYKDVSRNNVPYIGFARGKRIDKNYFRVNNHPFYFKDYGTTWALSREELE